MMRPEKRTTKITTFLFLSIDRVEKEDEEVGAAEQILFLAYSCMRNDVLYPQLEMEL